MSETSVQDTLEAYLAGVAISRSPNTARTYANAVNAFSASMRDKDRDPDSTDVRTVTENWIVDFARYLSSYSPASERLYLTALTGWYEYLAAEKQAEINLPRLRLLIRQRARRPGQRLPQFPRNDIEAILDYASNLSPRDETDEKDWWRA